jgi:hypothetical protein
MRPLRDSNSKTLEAYRFWLNQNRALIFCVDALSSREPASTSLENALVVGIYFIREFSYACDAL